MQHRPRLYVIGGPNGAGKTTFAMEYLPRHARCFEFVNADLIATGISPFRPESAAVGAGRALVHRVRELIARGDDLAVETTLAGRSIVGTMRDARRRGFVVHLYYLWVSSPEVSLARIAARVARGGHDVPEEDVRRRFRRGLVNLWDTCMQEADTWMLIENESNEPRAIAWRTEEPPTVALPDVWRRIAQAVERARQT
jgi:predicted ABC-type ATPase